MGLSADGRPTRESGRAAWRTDGGPGRAGPANGACVYSTDPETRGKLRELAGGVERELTTA
ncbi:hypothetical protein ACFYQA_27600 [Streptomyces sp. NPDC005774]|uniref:hypothetical protein n=1 Tax=Streptomyces sp. NPDC005774 TaxID=3364728 RepID=UPI0036C8C8EE